MAGTLRYCNTINGAEILGKDKDGAIVEVWERLDNFELEESDTLWNMRKEEEAERLKRVKMGMDSLERLTAKISVENDAQTRYFARALGNEHVENGSLISFIDPKGIRVMAERQEKHGNPDAVPKCRFYVDNRLGQILVYINRNAIQTREEYNEVIKQARIAFREIKARYHF